MVAEPVGAITLVFTDSVEVIPDGFEVLDPAGKRRRPAAVEGGGDSYVLRFDPPLAGGPVGVRWAVAATDGHVIEGQFSFQVDAPAPTTAPPTTAAPTTLPPTTAVPTTDPPTTAEPASTADSTATATTPVATTAAPTAVAPSTTDPVPTTTESLGDFLAGGDRGEPGSERFGHAGRILGFVGAVVGLGALVFVALLLVDRRPDRDLAFAIAAMAGVVTAIGAVVEGIGHAGEVSGQGLSVIGDLGAIADAWSSTFGVAVILRLAGGFVLALGCWLASRPSRSSRGPMPSPLMIVAAVALGVSFTFDGHTVSKGPRAVHAVVDLVHVGAVSVWVGGVVVLTALAWRHRRAEAGSPILAGSTVSAAVQPAPSTLLEVGLRFSIVAVWALLAVAAAGVVMALMILDGPGELTGTPWGRTLLVKLAGVVAAAGCGAYNRRLALPALHDRPDDPATRDQLRTALTVEAILLVAVLVVTTWLVGAVV